MNTCNINNNFNFDNDFKVAGDYLSKNEVLGYDVEEVEKMDIYPPIIPSDMQVDQDMTLNEHHFGNAEQVEYKEFLDLDKPIEKSFQEPFFGTQYCDFSKFQFEPESKEQLHHFQQPFNHGETLLSPSTPMSEYSTEYSLPTSPIPELGTYPTIGNNEMPRVTRSRRASKSEKPTKTLKVIAEEAKPYRSRATKAVMETMTPEERKDRKKSQNSKNARKCVEKKNARKEELEQLVAKEKNELRKIRAKNNQDETRLQMEYFSLDINNSPYGILDNFSSLIKKKLREVSEPIRLHNEPVIKELSKSFSVNEAKFNDLVDNRPTNINNNTYASQKSRAKKTMEIAKYEHEAAVLQDQIEQEQAKEAELQSMLKSCHPKMDDQPWEQPVMQQQRLPH